MRISFLHTASLHIPTFDRLFSELGVKAQLTHRVEPELLTRARLYGLESVKAETTAALSDLASADAVICTCSTLGPLADSFAKDFDHVFRIDRPVMEEACRVGSRILVAICLESTREATVALLKQCAMQLNKKIHADICFCDAAWPFFEVGDTDGFATSITVSITQRLREVEEADCIVLAQASMAVAAPVLASIGVPVLTSPLMAAKRSIQIANRSLIAAQR